MNLRKTFKSILCISMLSGIFTLSSIETYAHDNKWEYTVNNDNTVTIDKFKDNKNENVVVPNTIEGKKVTVIGAFAFAGNQTIKTVVLKNGIKIIRDVAFARCKNLEKVELPSTLKEIHESVFRDCMKLNSITIPSSVTEVGEYAFENCKSLPGSIHFGNTQLKLNINTFNHLPYRWIHVGYKWQYTLKKEGKYTDHETDIEFAGNKNGINKTAWHYINKKWYYFNKDNFLQTGWINDRKNNQDRWYYSYDSGLVYNWQKINNKWYFFNNDGKMLTGWIKSENKWYYLADSGAMLKGGQKINKKWYYLNDSGAMLTGWQKIKNKWYFLKGSGEMAANTWIGRYHVNSNGEWNKTR